MGRITPAVTCTCQKASDKFNKEARRLLRRTEHGKKLLHLLEEKPKPAQMRGLPKVHKAGVPMRPITSGIGSAPHRLAKCLAKPLSAVLGTISCSHLKNSADLLDRLKEIDVQGKKMASFDVKSLFTNVSVEGAMSAVCRVLQGVSDEQLPLPKDDYIKLVKLCVSFGSFQYNGTEYSQKSGLAMGNPLSAVLAPLFMETLEEDHYQAIVGQDATWLRYCDDVITFLPESTNLQTVVEELNRVDPSIQFTAEEEDNHKLAFLDVLIHRDPNSLRFSVYRKPTNKDDLIHFYSAHSTRVKSGEVIGFYLRALRICSPCFIQEELDYIVRSFLRLKFPLAMLIRLQKKAKNIFQRGKRQDRRQHVVIVAPTSEVTEKVTRSMGTEVSVVTRSGSKIGALVRKNTHTTNNDSVVYKIPCGTCNNPYFGEAGRGLQTRLKEHRADVRHHRTSNALVIHAEHSGHLPNWGGAGVLHSNLEKSERRAIEAAYITVEENINTSAGFFRLAKPVAHRIIKSIKS